MAVNEFLPFATMSTANVVAQADYALDPSTGNGFSAGIALSAKLNKVWRQASFVGAGLAQFMMERTNADVVDDGDLDKFVQQLYDSFVVTLTGTGDTRWVNITGDTMTGPLVLSADPVNILDAVTKQYVDNGFTYIGGIFGAYLPLAGGVLTGPLTLNANPTQPLHPATKAYVDQVFGGSGSALDPRYVNVAGDTMQGALHVLEPVATSNATTKFYVDDRDRIHTEYDNWYADNAVLNLRWYVDDRDQAIISWVSAAFMPIGGSAGYVLKTGDAMSGQLTLNAGLHVPGLLAGSGYSMVVDHPTHFREYIEVVGATYSGAYYFMNYPDPRFPFAGFDERQTVIFSRSGNVAFAAYGASENYLNYYLANRNAFLYADGSMWIAQFNVGHSYINTPLDVNGGVYLNGVFPGYTWTLAVEGTAEIRNLAVWENMTANNIGVHTNISIGGTAAIGGLVTCPAFNVTGNDTTIAGNISIGNICTVGNALSAPRVWASSDMWIGSHINTTQYQLNALTFAYHPAPNILSIIDPGGHSSLILYAGNSTNYYSNLVHQFVDYGYTATWVIFNSSGTYNAAGGSWLSFSNRELKRDIADYDRGLEALRKLRPISFVYNENTPLGNDQGRTRYGLIAEDVEEIIPEMTQADTINGQDIMAVATGHLVFVLTNAVKELADKLDALERRLSDDAGTTERTQRPRSGK